MKLSTTAPFSFDQTLTFVRRFPGCQSQARVVGDRVDAAFAAGGAGWAVSLRDGLTLETDARAPRDLARRAADWIGADDDLAPFYARAADDRAFAPIVRALNGLHHVRFLGLEDVAVHAVLMQRQSPAQTARMKQRFLTAFGYPVGGLLAMPELRDLCALSAEDVAAAIGDAARARRVVTVVRGLAAIGEGYLRTAPYDDAKAALLDIPGVGPFSATAILLRGLGRHDANPVLERFEAEGRAVYGDAWDPAAIARRYGDQIGYWTFYLKTGVARRDHVVTTDRGRRAPPARELVP